MRKLSAGEINIYLGCYLHILCVHTCACMQAHGHAHMQAHGHAHTSHNVYRCVYILNERGREMTSLSLCMLLILLAYKLLGLGTTSTSMLGQHLARTLESSPNRGLQGLPQTPNNKQDLLFQHKCPFPTPHFPFSSSHHFPSPSPPSPCPGFVFLLPEPIQMSLHLGR